MTLATLICLICLEPVFSLCVQLDVSDHLQAADEDSVRVEELLVLDTVHMKIDGPSNDMAFYRNGLVFLSNTKVSSDHDSRTYCFRTGKVIFGTS